MAGVIVTSSTNLVVFNANSLLLGFDKILRRKDHFVKITKYSTFIEYITFENERFKLSHDGNNGTVPVESINGVTPTDINHLCTLIEGILS